MSTLVVNPLIEETEAHVVILLLGWLRFLLFLLLLGSSWSSGGGGNSELRGVGEVLLHGLSLLEGDVSLGSDGEEGLVSDSQGDSGDVSNSHHESAAEIVVSYVKDCGVEDGAGVVHLLNAKTVLEGGNLQHVK